MVWKTLFRFDKIVQKRYAEMKASLQILIGIDELQDVKGEYTRHSLTRSLAFIETWHREMRSEQKPAHRVAWKIYFPLLSTNSSLNVLASPESMASSDRSQPKSFLRPFLSLRSDLPRLAEGRKAKRLTMKQIIENKEHLKQMGRPL